MFDTFEEILRANSANKIIPGLSRIRELLVLLNNPQDKFKSIHIVGTNGKGSTGAFISSVMTNSGYHTAFYSSPHLISPAERLLIDNEPLSESEWINALNGVVDVIDKVDEKPSYFELLTACAFVLMKKHNVDIAVVEAGLGGRFDATNTIHNVLCSVIASISIDHTEYLGKTLESIAGEKFAVIRENGRACFSGENESLIPMFKNECMNKHAQGFIVTENAKIDNITISQYNNSFDFHTDNLDVSVTTKLFGKYQINNAALALSCISLIMHDLPKITINTIKSGMNSASWPGRLEIIDDNIILDGGHNYDGIMKLCESVNELWGDKKIGVVYGAMRDKDYMGCLELMSHKLTTKLYLTTVPDMQRACKPKELFESAINFQWANIPEKYNNPFEAINQARTENEIIIICGSLYLIGYMRKKLMNKTSPK